jgi:hypothetical protein
MHIGDAMPGGDLLWSRVVDCIPPAERAMLGLYLGGIDHELTKALIREEHPEWSKQRVMIEYWRRSFLPEPLPKWLQQRFMEECEQYRSEF